MAIQVTTKNNRKSVTERLGKAIKEAAELSHKTLVDTTPVDTGNARDQWKMEQTSAHSYRSINTAPYTHLLDEGTSGQAPYGMTKLAQQAVEAHSKGRKI